ncbi:MAG: hypothetical protein KatS3mg001_145 [Candidatus Pacearchaeota archaeon]|nr:MAG: hypothetical protein KatS3mg001_145 [Candidatus Pacearchaeota archaeon]
MASFLLTLAGITLGVILAFYGLNNKKWLSFFVGLAIAIVSVYTAGLV